MKFIRLLPLAALLLAFAACIEDTIQLNDISKDIAIERQHAMPLIKTSLTFENLAGSYDSIMFYMGDTIFLYLNDDIGFSDTMKMSDMGENIEFDFFNLHYKVTNMFPIGLDMKIYLYDSLLAQNIDTIWFSEIPGELFIEPAPVDENDLAILDQVVTTDSYIGLDQGIFDNLFGNTTHLIIDAVVPSTGGFIKILKDDRLNMDIGIEFRGRYVTSIDSLFNF
jgi:hypothetical protein